MATIDSFFKPKLHRPKESQGTLHLSIMNDVGQSAVNGKDSNQNSAVKLPKTVSLDDSLEDFESSSKKLTPKPVAAANVSSKKTSSSKGDPSTEKKVVEISYADFLKGSDETDVGKLDEELDADSKSVEVLQDSTADLLKEQQKPEEKIERKEKVKKSAESIKSTKKPRSAFDLLKWNSKKEVLPVSDSLQSDSEETDQLEALPTKPAKGVTSFFKKVNKSEAFLKAKILVEAKAEVYPAPSPERSSSPTSIGSLKKCQKFQRTNVAVVDDSDLTEIEVPPTKIITVEKKVEVKRKLDEDFQDDCLESIEESGLDEVKGDDEAEMVKNDDMVQAGTKEKEGEEAEGSGDTVDKGILGDSEDTDVLKNPEIEEKIDLEDKRAGEEDSKPEDEDKITVEEHSEIEDRDTKTVEKGSKIGEEDDETEQQENKTVKQENKTEGKGNETEDDTDKENNKRTDENCKTEQKSNKTEEDNNESQSQEGDSKTKKGDSKTEEKDNNANEDDSKGGSKTEDDDKDRQIEETKNKTEEVDNKTTDEDCKTENEEKTKKEVNKTEGKKRIEVVQVSDDERDIPSPVVFIQNEALRKSVVEIVSDDKKLQKKSRVTLTRTDTNNKMQATLSFGAKGISIKRPVKTPKKVTRMRVISDEDFESPEEKKVRRSLRSPKKVLKSVRRSARFQDRNSEDEIEENRGQLDLDEPSPKKVFPATLPSPKKGKKKTPLKIRFTRSGSDSNTEESPVQRKDSKISRALELVKKAKEKKVKILQTQASPKSSELRRSCRRSAHVASQSITLTLKEIIQRKYKRKIVDVKVKPNPSEKITSKPAYSVKLAPIFKVKAKSSPESATVILSDDEPEIKVVLTEEEKEKERLKRAFLFSSIPNAVKKQITETTAPSDLPFAPWPSVSHVQQITESESPWSLPKDVSLPLALKSQEVVPCIVPAATTPGILTYCCRTSSLAEACPPRTKFSPESLKYLLAEVKTNNTAFPVYKCFRQMQKSVETPSEELADENDKKAKDIRRSRRGVKRNRNPEKVDTKATPKATAEQSLQWTEKLAPNHSSDFFCNTKAVKRLHSWLSEWKHRTDLDLKKAMRAEMLKARRSGKSTDDIRKTYADALWTDDIDDFDMSGESDSDADESEDTLCNTMLVQGPHGCGKTSVVYALAQELGYKVFEVNASQKRSGRQIISELQEATQSHQVSMHKTCSTLAPAAVPAAKTPIKAKPEKGKKAPNALSTFFSKKADAAKPSPVVVQQAKKTKVKDETITNNTDVTKKVNLSGVSLILFEDADVVLEEDRGFWSAVQTFIQTTKRPILLTASDANLADKLTCRMETLQLKVPSANQLASYLQLVCLQEGLRTSHEDLTAVASLFNCDIRRSLLSLQFWVQSGICSRSPLAVTYNRKHLRVDEKQIEKPKLLENHAQSDDAFEVAPRKRRRKCRTILDEDSGPEISLVVANEDSQSSIPEFLPFSPDVRETETIELAEATHVHQLFFETLCNVAEFTGPHTAVQCLRSKSKDALTAISVSTAVRQFSINLVHSNLLSLLPLKRTVSNFSYLRLTTPTIKPGSRISNTNDLFDSEASEDGFPSLKSSSRDSFEQEKIEIPTGANTDEKLQKMIMAINDQSFDEKPGKRYLARSLHSMASMYDALSFTDTLSTHNSTDGWAYGSVTSGDLDHVTQTDDSDWCNQQYTNEIACTIEVLQLRRTNMKLKKLKEKICKYSPEEIQVPVDRLSDCVNTQHEPSLQISSAEATAKAGLRVRDNLPASSRCDHRSLAVDYLPMLRFICRSEQLRAMSGRKRRFLHYLDSVIRELKESVVSTLCSAF